MLADLPSIALEWAKNYVRQRQTFKMNTKGENTAPLAFQSDPDGTYHDLAVQLRNLEIAITDPDGSSMALVEPVEENESSPVRTTTDRPSARSSGTPHVPETPARLEQLKFQRQQAVIKTWIDDPRHVAEATCRHALELYAQLNDSEFLYVSDLQSTYDEVRCFFLQGYWGKKLKSL